MKIRLKKYVLPAAAMFLLCSVPSFAQNIHLTIFGGYNNPGDLTLENLRTGLDGTGIVGVRFETDLARVLGLEHTFGVMPDFAASSAEASLEDATGIVYNSNLVLNLPLSRFVPYVTAGVGLMHSEKRFTPSREFGTRFAVNYGGGLKFVRLAGPLGARIDVRGYSLPDAFSDTLNFFETSGGLMFSW